VAGDEIIGQIAVTYEWSDWRKKPTKKLGMNMTKYRIMETLIARNE